MKRGLVFVLLIAILAALASGSHAQETTPETAAFAAREL